MTNEVTTADKPVGDFLGASKVEALRDRPEPDANSPDRMGTGASLLTARQAAKVLAIGTRKLWTMTNCGEIRHVRIGRSVRYDINDLLRWISNNKHGGE